MKVKATMREEVHSNANHIVVEFKGDDKKQHFEVKCTFDSYQIGIEK